VSETTEHAVIALFDESARAEQAAHELMSWDKANDDIKLGAVGLLTREGGTWGQGAIKVKNFSSRNTGKGAKVGLGLGAIAAVLSGGWTLIPGAGAGAVAGGAAGSLSHKSLGLTDDELQQLLAKLDVGGAALLVMCDEPEAQATADYLVQLGGTSRTHVVNGTDLQAAVDAATAEPSSDT
jgi:uncharacterized membrane protein